MLYDINTHVVQLVQVHKQAAIIEAHFLAFLLFLVILLRQISTIVYLNQIFGFNHL